LPLTPDDAARIARRHGLTLQDAAGLLTLADHPDDAERIAAAFARPDPDTTARKLAEDLFTVEDDDRLGLTFDPFAAS
jgi:hypothetical protein